MCVEKIMTQNPVTVAPHDSVRWVIHLMKKGGFHRLPVMEEGRLVGIVTDRDVRLAMDSPVVLEDYGLGAYLRERWYDEWPLDNIRVEACMTPEPITVTPDTSIEEAARLMRNRQIGCLPVMQGEELVGIVTETDVLDCFIELLENGAALEPKGRCRRETVKRWTLFSGRKGRQTILEPS